MSRRTFRSRISAASVLSLLLFCNLADAETVITLTDSGSATTNGTNLQNEITAAANRAGETRIVLPAGVIFSRSGTSFTLPNKTLDNAYCTIESSDLASMPPNKRVSPGDAGKMPKLVTLGSNLPALRTSAGAHHFRVRGIEMTSSTAATFNSFVLLGDGGSAQDTFAEVPHHIEIDRCYIHSFGETQALTRCIALNSGTTVISNSYLSGAKAGNDAQAIQGSNGTGPYFIVNNYLEGAAENFMIGGAGTTLPNGTVPADIHFKRNHCAKPLIWKTNPQGTWAIKNLFEIKFGKRFDIDGNLFENSWAGGQEFAIVIKVDSNNISSNTNAETVTEDVLFRNNKVRHAPSGVALQGRDWLANFTPTMERITIRNNTFEDISRATWGATSGWGGAFAHLSNGTKNVTIENNTCFQDRYVLVVENATWPNQNTIFRNNVTHWGTTYGGVRNESQNGSTGLNISAPGAIFQKNTMLSGLTSWFTGANHTPNYFPTSWASVFVNQPSGDYHIVPGSVYATGGTDGKPVGANVDVVNKSTEDCESGAWDANDIVLYASEAPVKVGPWSAVADATAAGGSRLAETDAGLAKVTTPLAAPASYFEMTFNARGGVPYRLWIRGKGASTSSDSVHVQFTNTLNAAGAAAYRIGTTSSIEWVLENGSGAGISNWGWRDSSWGTTVSETRVVFANSGTQTIRCQRREDGVSIDQIVLSPCTYIGDGPAKPNPGTEKDDTTILARNDGTAGSGDIVLYAWKAPTRVGNWAVEADATAAGGSKIRDPNTGAAKIDNPLASPAHYFEVPFNAQAGVGYRLWLRIKADSNSWPNDSVHVQFNDSVDSGGAAVYRIGTTNGTWVSGEETANQGLSNWGWSDNGYGTVPTWGPVIYFPSSGSHTIRVQRREDGVAIDQIVLSPVTYMNAAPGPQKNDTTILPEQ